MHLISTSSQARAGTTSRRILAFVGVLSLAVLTVGVTTAKPASAATSAMVIDGTSLTPIGLNLVDESTSDTTVDNFNTSVKQSVQLAPGTYEFDESGYLYDCTVVVTASGTWTLNSECDGATASGSTLTLSGFSATVATPGLSTGVTLPSYGLNVPPNGSGSLVMMPITAVNTYLSGGAVTLCSFTMEDTGDVALTSGCGASAAIASGNAVDFKGFPVEIDGTDLSTNEYELDADNTETEVPSDVVHDYNLLPNPEYEMQVSDESVVSFYFGVDSSGHFTDTAPSDSAFLSGIGSTDLVLEGLPVHINATAALGATSNGTYTLGDLTFAGSYSDSTPENLKLLPTIYGWTSSTGSPATFNWTLDNDGEVVLPTPTPDCAYGSMTSTLVIDCGGSPSATEVSGAPMSVAVGNDFTITGAECDSVESATVTGSISVVDTTTGVSLGTIALGSDSMAENCGEAQVTDSEQLTPGNYTITATYLPSGSNQVPTSAAATYVEKVTSAVAGIPTITNVTPNEGPVTGGTAMTISGTNFTGATKVLYGTVPATSFVVISSSTIFATAPAQAAAATHNVYVTTPVGTNAAVSADDFTYTTAKPAVTGLSPSSGPVTGGTTVTITGTDFGDTTKVLFGTVPATTYTEVSATELTAVDPAQSAATHNVYVVTPNGQSAAVAADDFTYSSAKPAVTGLSPSSGPVAGGNTVTITGTALGGTTKVLFGTVAATSFSVISLTEITAVVPAQAAATHNVYVTTPNGESAAVAADDYTYTSARPAVTGVSPTSGPPAGGTVVTITGTAFGGATQVLFGAVAATSFTVVSSTQITAVAPAQAAATHNMYVTTSNGQSAAVAADDYVYT